MACGNATGHILPPFDSDKFILLTRRVGYATGDWQAGASQLRTDIEQHMALTKEFFEQTFGRL
jgi:hypothetical protein